MATNNVPNITKTPLPPQHPVDGDIWTDTRDHRMHVWQGNYWVVIQSAVSDGTDEYGGGVPDVGPENVPRETLAKCSQEEAQEKLSYFIGNLEIPDPRGRLDLYVKGVDPYQDEETIAKTAKEEVLKQYRDELFQLQLEFYVDTLPDTEDTLQKRGRARFLEAKIKQLESTPVAALAALRRAVVKNFNELVGKPRHNKVWWCEEHKPVKYKNFEQVTPVGIHQVGSKDGLKYRVVLALPAGQIEVDLDEISI